MPEIRLIAVIDENGRITGVLPSEIAVDANGNTIITDADVPRGNTSAITNPTANDDITQDWQVGSHWINIIANTAFINVDNTEGAAVWTNLSTGTGDGTIIAVGTPTDGSFDTGIVGLDPSDSIADGHDKLDEFLAVLAAEVVDVPGILTGESLVVGGASTFSATLPSGLSAAWIDSAGTNITGYTTTASYVLDTPDSANKFRAGTTTQGQASAGQVTHILNGSASSVHDIAISGVGSTGDIEATALVAHNGVFQRANARINFTSTEGKVRHAIQHTESGTTNETVLYYDDVASAPSFSIAPSHSVGVEVLKDLSGISYYTIGTRFDVSYEAASGIFTKAYHPTAVSTISVPGAASININPGGTPAVGDTLTVTNSPIFLGATNITDDSFDVTVTLNKPDGQTTNATDTIARKINTYTTASTSTSEFFFDEAQRLVLNTDTAFNSSATLVDGNSQVFNKDLRHGAVGDYGGFSGDQEYQRKFSKVSASNGTLTLGGITVADVDPFGTGDLNILIELDTDGIFFDLGKVVGDNNGAGDGSTRADSFGGKVGTSSGSALNFSLLTFSTGSNSNEYRIIIIFKSTAEIITQIVSS